MNYEFKLNAVFNAVNVDMISTSSVSVVSLFGPPPSNMISVPVAGMYATDPASPNAGNLRFTQAVTDVTGGEGFSVAQMLVTLTNPVNRKVYHASLTCQVRTSNASDPLSVVDVGVIVNHVVQEERNFSGWATLLPLSDRQGPSYELNLYLSSDN